MLETELSPSSASTRSSSTAPARSLLAVINDILDFSKIEAGRVELEVIPFDLRSLVDEAVRTLRPLAREKRLALAAEIDPTLPAAVAGDPARLRQVHQQPASNALKFTAEGGVTLRLQSSDESGGRVRVRIQVDDTGIGIPPDAAAAPLRVLHAGRRLHHAPVRRHRPRPRDLQAAGGADGRGDRLRQPRARGQLVLVRGALAARGGGGRACPGGPLPAVRRTRDAAEPPVVLVVEDNPVNQKLAVRILQRLGYRTETADHGRQALEALDASGLRRRS